MWTRSVGGTRRVEVPLQWMRIHRRGVPLIEIDGLRFHPLGNENCVECVVIRSAIFGVAAMGFQ